MFKDTKDKLFCEVASDLNIVNDKQIASAFSQQQVDAAIGTNKPISAYLFEAGAITKEQIAQILKIQDKYASNSDSPAVAIPSSESSNDAETPSVGLSCFGCLGLSFLVILVFFVIGIFAPNSGPMPFTEENLVTWSKGFEGGMNAGLLLGNHDQATRGKMFCEAIVKPIEDMGYSFDDTLMDALKKYESKNFSMEELTALVGFLSVVQSSATTLEQSKVISSDVAARLKNLKI